MFVAYAAVGVLLALALVFSAIGKLTRNPVIVQNMTTVGAAGLMPFLAGCEIAGALGLLAGLGYPPLGIAAAVGVVLYFVGAIVAHLRVRDYKGTPGALVLLIVAGAALALRVLSL
ncbi:DoxX family protein [Marinactinospora rubrisoli]|uniref:DoxX family protein n=1 Tax=Marinactinospora rubrisoli TaxID=2715399 RepID=A0ABW2KEX8_9ACTN